MPQGSVLSPLLFTVFIGNIMELIDILFKFADDMKLRNTASSPEDKEKLQLDLDKVCKWART